MIRRIALPALLLGTLLAAPVSAQAAQFGFSDQQSRLFTNPLYKDLKKVKIVRYIAPYDVATDAKDKAIFDAWLAGANATNDRVLVGFYYDRENPLKLPSTAKYKKAITAFKKLYPTVREIQPYNEANRNAPGRFKGPSAKQAAAYYKAARQVFKGSKYKITALDVLDERNIKPALKYTKAFLKEVKRLKLPTPKLWGFHNYSDTNRNSSARTAAFLKTVKGEVWVTETGGLVQFGGSFPYDEKRAAKALTQMFAIQKKFSKRITRLYIFNFFGSSTGFDAGVVNEDGDKPRPGYAVVKKKLG